jgi:hypothetical protein
MTHMKKRNASVILLMICCLVLPAIAHAQIIDPNDTPIDGGLSLLLAAGAAYGVKKYRDEKKKGEEEVGGL